MENTTARLSNLQISTGETDSAKRNIEEGNVHVQDGTVRDDNDEISLHADD